MGTKEIILSYMGSEPAKRLAAIDADTFGGLSEIRLRTDKPLLVYAGGREYAVTDDGRITGGMGAGVPVRGLYAPSAGDIAETLERVSRYSLYAFEEELRMGYITLPGGHRVGMAGQAAVERQSVRTLKYITGLNIRIAHQAAGCASAVLPYILAGGTRPLFHTMIISPPGCGKTTLLRDIVRQVSDGIPGLCRGLTVGLVDERSEIAGCYRGVAQNDVGRRTDVLDGCPKAEGMTMLLRAMGPDVIAVDEIGGERDARAVEDVLNAGVKLLCTAHGDGVEDIKRKPALKALTERLTFERFVVLAAPGHIAGVYGPDGGALHAA